MDFCNRRDISVAGVNLHITEQLLDTNIEYVAQKFSLTITLSVFENLWFFGVVYMGSLKLRENEYKRYCICFIWRKEQDVAGRLPLGYK